MQIEQTEEENIKILKQHIDYIDNSNQAIISFLQGMIDSQEDNSTHFDNQQFLISDSNMEDNMKYLNLTISRRKDRKHSYYAKFTYESKQYTIYGKTQQEVIKKFKELKKNNYKLLKQKIENKQNNVSEYSKDIKLKKWYEQYMKLYKINKVTDTTVKSYDYDFKKLKTLHNISLKKLNAITIQECINNIEYESTQIRVYTMLNAILEKATILNIIDKNPMKVVDKPKYKSEQKIALTKDEESSFINACKNHKYGDYYLICLFQGLRKGECRALKVNDVDLHNKTLRIDESLNTHTTRTNTKNSQSVRTMPLFNKSEEILLKHIKGKKEDELIFNIGVNRIDKALKEILSTIKIRHISTHILRHTFITRCQEQNIPLYITQAWVGHEKGSVVTTKIYTHLNRDIDKKYAEIINKNT